MRTEILPLATYQIPHLCKQFNYGFALLVSLPRFKIINIFIKLGTKLSYFCETNHTVFER